MCLYIQVLSQAPVHAKCLAFSRCNMHSASPWTRAPEDNEMLVHNRAAILDTAQIHFEALTVQGTVVTAGRARAVVVCTGPSTAMGKIR